VPRDERLDAASLSAKLARERCEHLLLVPPKVWPKQDHCFAQLREQLLFLGPALNASN